MEGLFAARIAEVLTLGVDEMIRGPAARAGKDSLT